MSRAARPRLLFVVVADNRIGFGHLNRCLSMARVAAPMGVASQFIIFGDEQAAALASRTQFPFQRRPVDDLARSFACEPVDAAVVDVIYPAFFRDGNAAMELFGGLLHSARVVAAIDSLGEETIAAQARDVPIDFLVVPYALAEPDTERLSMIGCGVLAGAEYAVLSPDYIGQPQREQRAQAERVLVTCGGSDPLGWTTVVLRGLDNVAGHLTVRVVVGPLFSLALRTEIAMLAAASRHGVEIVESPESLAAHMQWCDVAVAASGLTKYELAATGTPTILFSIDAFHDVNNRAFSALRVAEDLGAAPSQERIADAIRDLLADRERREAMATSGRRLIDGRGAQRLVAKTMEKLSCRKEN